MTIYSWGVIEAIALYVFLFWIGVRTVRKGKAGIKTGEPIIE